MAVKQKGRQGKLEREVRGVQVTSRTWKCGVTSRGGVKKKKEGTSWKVVVLSERRRNDVVSSVDSGR